MSLSKPTLPAISPLWPSELMQLVIHRLLAEYFDYRDSDIGWQGPVVGTKNWKLAQAIFRLRYSCKGMRQLFPISPGRDFTQVAGDSETTWAWTQIAGKIAELDEAIERAKLVGPFSCQPGPLRDYTLYRIEQLGSGFIGEASFREFDTDQVQRGLQYTDSLGADGRTWYGTPTSHIKGLARAEEEKYEEEELRRTEETAKLVSLGVRVIE